MFLSFFTLIFLLISFKYPILSLKENSSDINNYLLSTIDSSIIKRIIKDYLIDSENDYFLKNSIFLIQKLLNNSETILNSSNNTKNDNSQLKYTFDLEKYSKILQIVIELCENPISKPLMQYISNSSLLDFVALKISIFTGYFSDETALDLLIEALYDYNVTTDLKYILEYFISHEDLIIFFLSIFDDYLKEEVDIFNILNMIRESPKTFLDILNIISNGTQDDVKKRVDQIKDIRYNVDNFTYIMIKLPEFIKENDKLFNL